MIRAVFVMLLQAFCVFPSIVVAEIDLVGMEDGRLVFVNLGLVGTNAEGDIHFVGDTDNDGVRTCYFLIVTAVQKAARLSQLTDCAQPETDLSEDPAYLARYNMLNALLDNTEVKSKLSTLELPNYNIMQRDEIDAECGVEFTLPSRSTALINPTASNAVISDTVVAIHGSEVTLIIDQIEMVTDSEFRQSYRFAICD